MTVRTDEAINQYWGLHLREMEQAKGHGEKAAAFEDEASQRRAHASKRREDAAQAIREAESQEASAEVAARNAADLRQAEQHHRDVAADHAETVQDKCTVSGRKHPAERQQQYGQVGERTQTPQNGSPVVDNEAMDTTGMVAAFKGPEGGAP